MVQRPIGLQHRLNELLSEHRYLQLRAGLDKKGKLRLDSCCGEGGAWLTCVRKTPQQHLGPDDFKQRGLARLGMPMHTRMSCVCKHGTREIFDECVEELCA